VQVQHGSSCMLYQGQATSQMPSFVQGRPDQSTSGTAVIGRMQPLSQTIAVDMLRRHKPSSHSIAYAIVELGLCVLECHKKLLLNAP
jgi:hypothetical protein